MGYTAVMAGAAKTTIDLPQSLFPIENLQGVHDPLRVRLLYLICGGEKQVFVSLELTSIRDYEIAVLRKLLSEILETEEENIWICVTHTFSAPHTRSAAALADVAVRVQNEQLCQAIETAVRAAALEALEQLQPVVVSGSIGRSFVNVSRDVETPEGWWLGKNPEGYSDRQLPILCFETPDHEVKAVLYNYDMQSSILKEYCRISGDVAGVASSYIENKLPGSVALFCLGAAGDQTVGKNPVSGTESFQEAVLEISGLGDKLGGDVMKAVGERHPMEVDGFRRGACKVPCSRQKRPENMRELRPVRTYAFEEEGNIETPVRMFVMGDFAAVGVQPEISSITGNRIRTGSPYPVTMVLTMVNGGAKYMPDARAYDRITYEAMNSNFSRGSAEKLEESVVELFSRLRKGEKEE